MESLTPTPTLSPISLAKTMLLTFAIATLIFAGCAHSDPQDPDSPKISLVNPAASGRDDAHRDLKAGKMQLIEVPQIGLAPPDEASNDPRLGNLTKRYLETDGRHKEAWVKYAKAYNAVVIKEFEREITR
jgi:hypothetical protein